VDTEGVTVSLAGVTLSLPSGPGAILVVSALRRFVVDALRHFIGDEDRIAEIAIVAHELFENAAKYANRGTAELTFELVSEPGGQGRIRVQTRNHATADEQQLLEGVVGRIAAAVDPVALYDEFIRDSLAREGSGLGLARIQAESTMKLTWKIEGETVVLSAEGLYPLTEVR